MLRCYVFKLQSSYLSLHIIFLIEFGRRVEPKVFIVNKGFLDKKHCYYDTEIGQILDTKNNRIKGKSHSDSEESYSN